MNMYRSTSIGLLFVIFSRNIVSNVSYSHGSLSQSYADSEHVAKQYLAVIYE